MTTWSCRLAAIRSRSGAGIGAQGAYRAGRPGDEGVEPGLLGVGQGRFGLLGQPVQGGQPVAVVVVAELVDQPGEAVEGQQVVAGVPPEQPRGHLEVLAGGPAEDRFRRRARPARTAAAGPDRSEA